MILATSNDKACRIWTTSDQRLRVNIYYWFILEPFNPHEWCSLSWIRISRISIAIYFANFMHLGNLKLWLYCTSWHESLSLFFAEDDLCCISFYIDSNADCFLQARVLIFWIEWGLLENLKNCFYGWIDLLTILK